MSSTQRNVRGEERAPFILEFTGVLCHIGRTILEKGFLRQTNLPALTDTGKERHAR